MMLNPTQAISLSKQITMADNETLIMEVLAEDIFDAVKQINSLKASGPYNMEAIFYHTARTF